MGSKKQTNKVKEYRTIAVGLFTLRHLQAANKTLFGT